jgi:hypothetical protein
MEKWSVIYRQAIYGEVNFGGKSSDYSPQVSSKSGQPLLFLGSIYPLNCVIWSNLPLSKIYLLYLSMHKRSLEFKFCRMIEIFCKNILRIFYHYFDRV